MDRPVDLDHRYVTRREFNEFRTDVNTRLDLLRANSGFSHHKPGKKRLLERNPLALRFLHIARSLGVVDDGIIDRRMASGSICHVCQIKDGLVVKLAFQVALMNAEYAKVQRLSQLYTVERICDDQPNFSSFFPKYYGDPVINNSCAVPFSYITMEKLLSLRECMKDGGLLDSDDSKINLVWRLLHFLQRLNDMEDFHGDIKHSNLMIRPPGDGRPWQLVVIDWSEGFFTPRYNYSGIGDPKEANVRDMFGLLTLVPWLFDRPYPMMNLEDLKNAGLVLIKMMPLLRFLTNLEQFPMLRMLPRLVDLAEKEALTARLEAMTAEKEAMATRLEAFEAQLRKKQTQPLAGDDLTGRMSGIVIRTPPQ
eukprot:gnl/Dysnectes_brevis/3885_a5026_712.p1 GENE.gnl/Dysnectes_brevis/3885_a5026_712~~gnl/Dysnectes_brevis/3885_a5026_712.p1  ORF type:complete len:365 (-),score=44.56 gnl/Dysnectes_brevis/3885_a5026_712:33-1127(-)